MTKTKLYFATLFLKIGKNWASCVSHRGISIFQSTTKILNVKRYVDLLVVF